MNTYKKAWTKRPLHLPHGMWPASLVSTTEAAGILGCSTRTLERYRNRGIGPQPEPEDRYIGRPRFYVAWKLLAWRSSVLGYGPTSYREVMDWFCTNGTLSEPRTPPSPRPGWRPRGEPRWKAKSRFWRKIRCDLARIEMEEKMIELSQRAAILSKATHS